MNILHIKNEYDYKGFKSTTAVLKLNQSAKVNESFTFFADVYASETQTEKVETFTYQLSLIEIKTIENNINADFFDKYQNLTTAAVNFLLTQPNPEYPSEALGDRWQINKKQ